MIGWWAVAWAELPPPAWDDELARRHWRAVDELLETGCGFQKLLAAVVCAEGVPERAVEEVDRFGRSLFRDASLEYLAGLAYKYARDNTRAIQRYEAALALDPELAEAWYDLGEIRMTEGRYADAQTCFEHVTRIRDTGPVSWVGPWRLAEVAAARHDAPTFERHIKLALERGFTFRHVLGLPNWQAYYADPALRDVLDKLLTVYSDDEVRRSLEP